MSMTSWARVWPSRCSATTVAGLVVVVQVVRRDRAQRPDQLDRQCRRARPTQSASVASSSGQAVDAVDAGGTLPAQVVQPDVLERHVGPARRRAARRCVRWMLIATLHRPDRPVAVVEERLGHDPDRVREVDDPGPRRRAPSPRVRRARGRPAPFAAPWRSRRHRSSPGRSTPKRGGSVSSTSRVAWPPTRSWMSTKSAPSMARVAIAGQGQPAGPVEPVEHPLGEPADDREPLGVDVEQDELVDRQPRRARGRSPRPAPACRCCRRRRRRS